MAIGKAKACADSANELVPEEYERNTKGRCTCLWAPRGVVAAICPWNFPLAIAVNKMLCPLVGGNTVVLKPSPMTPLSTLLLSDLAMEAFPPGVVNILAGGSDVGAVLVEHPDVATVTFTGSSATGKRIMASASPSLKKAPRRSCGSANASASRHDPGSHLGGRCCSSSGATIRPSCCRARTSQRSRRSCFKR